MQLEGREGGTSTPRTTALIPLCQDHGGQDMRCLEEEEGRAPSGSDLMAAR